MVQLRRREPPHCHIVLYTPGRGEGGGPQQVFCSGQCPDGQPCRLSEQLIHKGDGFQVFHLVCACYGDHGNPNHSSGENDGKPADPTDPDQEVPDPTNPGNDPDTGNEEPVPSEQDSVNPEPDGSIQDNDDPCCGDNVALQRRGWAGGVQFDSVVFVAAVPTGCCARWGAYDGDGRRIEGGRGEVGSEVICDREGRLGGIRRLDDKRKGVARNDGPRDGCLD